VLAPSDGPAIAARAWLRTGALACLIVIGAAAPSLPRGVGNWDNVVKLQVARSLLRGDGLVIGGLTPDDASYVQIGTDGRRYSGYMPLAAALHVITIQVALLTGVEAEGAPALLLLGLVAWALVSWGRRAGVSRGAAVAGAVTACLGTALWPMAALGYDVLVEVLALALILRAAAGRGESAGQWLLAGFAVGGAFATRLGAATLAVPAIVVALAAHERGARPTCRRVAALAAGSAPGVLLVLWYNLHRFGSPFVVFRPNALGTLEDLAAPWFSILHLQGIAGLLLSPGKGLFWYAPPMLLVALAATTLARRHRTEALAIGAYGLVAIVFFGRFRYWHGDWGWGPRYVAPLFLAAAPLAWLVAERIRAARPRVKAAGLSALVGAVLLQAGPVMGRPVPYHFALVLAPLEAKGELSTRPVTRPPGPEDYGVLYFAPQNSMLVSLARGLARATGKDGFWERVLRALVVPLAAGVFVAHAWSLGPRDERTAVDRAAPGRAT
jgi:hypothetical protein